MKLPLRNNENRTTYRVKIGEDQATLWIGLRSGPVKATLEDLSSRGCGFLLPKDEVEGIEAGSEVVLRMKVGGGKTPQLFIRAEVRARQEVGELAQFGVVFKDADRLYQQLTVEQWRIFNRRGAFRVPPANHRGEPLRASFSDADSEAPKRFTVNDLSSSGLSIRLTPGRDFELSETQPVRVEFELPNGFGAFSFSARFVHRSFVKGIERIGMVFDKAATESFEAQSESLPRYVLERQSELLRGSWAVDSWLHRWRILFRAAT